MREVFLRCIWICCLNILSCSSWSQQRTYCNPINIDYGYTRRSGAPISLYIFIASFLM